MLTEVDAVRYDRKMSNGKTKPVLLACERDTGEEIELVAKFSKGCDNSCDGLVREAIAAALAKDLGLPIPRPYIVNISPEFIATIPDPEIATLLHASCSKGYGSERLPDGYSTWVQPAKPSAALILEAQGVIVFDALTTNADRRRGNPNLLFNGSRIAMIDHELSLMTDLNIFWQAPWLSGSLDGHYSLNSHVLYSTVKGNVTPEISDISKKFSLISDERIEEYSASIPVEWMDSKECTKRVVNFIRDLRTNIAPAISEITKALS